MKIISAPNPVLRQKSEPLTPSTKHLTRLLDEVGRTLMHNQIGVGLAAPQIGYNYRFLATKLPHPDHPKQSLLTYYLNPIITAHSSELTLRSPANKNDDLEGCLSVPKIYAPVYRYTWIEITYQEFSPSTHQFIERKVRLNGFPARVLQHEIDHLDGILFIDRALLKNLPLYKDINGDLKQISTQDFYQLFGQFI